MTGTTEVMSLLKRGAEIVCELRIGVTTFRVILGLHVSKYPIALLKYMKEKRLVQIENIFVISTIYKLRKRKKDATKT